MVRNNLPTQTTEFIGREEELAEIASLLADPACRLLTLLGPGGIGKTRLALQAGWEVASDPASLFPDGVFFIPLQSLSSSEYIVPAIAEAIQFPFKSQEDPRSQLLHYLSDQRMLLVLDNFEHLLEAAELAAAILEAAASIKILVTSREVLGLREEWLRPVHGLKYPESEADTALEAYSAVLLFGERARQVQASFSLDKESACAARICRLVQGMPLAIELAAAWLKTLPCSEVAGEVQHSLDFLATRLRNVPERHRSVRAVFEQTWKLLAEKERDVFKRLAVFQGGFQREAAQAVADSDLHILQALVDKSLLRLDPSGRYGLHELLRQYALEKLDTEPDERERVERKHGQYYSDFLQIQEARLRGQEQTQALAKIDAEIDNLRAAWHWAITACDEFALRKSLGALFMFYQMRTRLVEGLEAFQQAIQAFEGSGSPVLADLCLRAGWFDTTLAKYEDGARLFRSGLDRLGTGDYQATTAMALAGLSFFNPQENPCWTQEEIQDLFEQNTTRFESTGDHWGAAWSLYSLGAITFQATLLEQSRAYLLRSIDHFRGTGDRWGSTWALNQLAITLEELEAYHEAKEVLEESLQICQEIGDLGGVAFALASLSDIASIQHEYESSWQYTINALEIGYDTKRDHDICWNLVRMAKLLETYGKKEEALSLLAFVYEFPRFHFTREFLREDGLIPVETEFPPEVYERAWRRWQGSSLETVIQYLRAEYGSMEKPSVQITAAPGGSPPDASQKLVEPLSPREREVLALVVEGLSNREIAGQLFITVGAVKKHLNNIFGKLEVQNRTQAAARGRSLGLIPE